MTAPIRTSVFTLTDWGDTNPAEWTIRDAVEWSKRLVREIDTPNAQEIDFVNKRFMEAMKQMADTQKIPVGFLMYMVHELTATEIRLLDTAQAEAETAGP